MARYFKSDNTAPASPEILQALSAANDGYATGYGDDALTARLDSVLGSFFGCPVRAFPVATGTAANSLALATVVPPWGNIYCHHEAHVIRDECGAPEFMTGGARLTLLSGADGKFSAETLTAALKSNPPSVHTMQPAAITLTQATELGTSWRDNEIAAVTAVAHAANLSVHMDGARFANAVSFLRCEPADITWRAGVDVLSFGATKNGALAAEAVVFFNRSLVRDFELRRKRAAHLFSKMRFLSAQLLAYVETGVWKRNADRANALAQRIAIAAGQTLLHPVEANELFLRVGPEAIAQLRAQGFQFYDWGREDSGALRLVVSWDQPDEDVAAITSALKEIRQAPERRSVPHPHS